MARSFAGSSPQMPDMPITILSGVLLFVGEFFVIGDWTALNALGSGWAAGIVSLALVLMVVFTVAAQYLEHEARLSAWANGQPKPAKKVAAVTLTAGRILFAVSAVLAAAALLGEPGTVYVQGVDVVHPALLSCGVALWLYGVSMCSR